MKTPALSGVSPPARQARIRGHAFSPGTEDYPPRLLIGFVDGDGTWIVNLKEGIVRKAKADGFEEDYIQWPTFIDGDGKLFSSCGRGGLSVYDPVTDTIKLVRPLPDARWLRGMAIGPDGAVYVSDYPTGSAAKYDPQTGKVTHFGRQGGPFDIPSIYGYSVGFDGRYVYTAVGKIPWYVVAYDTHTGQQKNLLRFESTDHPEVHQRGDTVFLEVKYGSPQAKASASYFRLADGRVEPADTIPRFDDGYVPGNDRPQPEIEPLNRNLPIGDGGAAVRYRPPGGDWTTVESTASDELLQYVGKFSKLRELSLTFSDQVTDVGIEYLSDLTRLRDLDLVGTSVEGSTPRGDDTAVVVHRAS